MLVYDVTDDDLVAPLAGAMFLLPLFVFTAAVGFGYVYGLCGLLAIYLYTRGYPALSGVAAAASVGSWQAGAISR